TGGADYEPRIVLARGALRSSCTCPYDGGLVCKHVVALGLAVLDRAPRAAPAPGERVGFASRDALEAWAAERQVTHALARPAATLADRIAVAPGWLFIGGRTVADVAVATTTI
ncbi:MAG: SWIM zinc finger family protein, partial [Kofleriaceae bacterium]|nr:SWIM zinc finger family protein [Kofleriaceae bacterium]